jgi:hypothetical protein
LKKQAQRKTSFEGLTPNRNMTLPRLSRHDQREANHSARGDRLIARSTAWTMRSPLFLLILIGLFLNGASAKAASGENLPKGADKNKNSPQIEKANPENQTQRIAPTEFEKSLIETLRTIANQQRTAYEEARADQKPWWIDYGLLAVAAIYTGFAGLQWWAIREQAKVATNTLAALEKQVEAAFEQGKISRISGEAATQAAKAAEESNKHAREVASKELRAYVLVTNIRLSGAEKRYDDRAEKLERILYNSFDVTFRNSGRTPGYSAVATRNWYLQPGIDTKLPKDFAFPERRDGALFSRFTLGPSLLHRITFSIDHGDVELARHGQWTLYVYGDLKYTDIFGIEQTTPFCFFYVKEFGREGFAMYERHNDPT